MSNKTLAYLLAGIIIIVAGVFLIMRLQTNDQSQKAADNYGESLTQNPASQPQNQQGGSSSTPVAQNPEACERKFDAEKLKTAKVEIKGRQAEIDVKGFGKIAVEFYDKDAPKTVENFLRLANAGYFDCLTFHRVAKGFVIQGGDPTGTGSGGESAFGGEFADEVNPTSALYQAGYKKGVVAMANRGPNTNTSQFFIMLSDAGLAPAYTIFGHVTVGLDTVDKIGAVEIVPQLGPTDGKRSEERRV